VQWQICGKAENKRNASVFCVRCQSTHLALLRLRCLEALLDALAALHALRLLHALEQLQRRFVARAALRSSSQSASGVQSDDHNELVYRKNESRHRIALDLTISLFSVC